jgi:hypothetical protein
MLETIKALYRYTCDKGLVFFRVPRYYLGRLVEVLVNPLDYYEYVDLNFAAPLLYRHGDKLRIEMVGCRIQLLGSVVENLAGERTYAVHGIRAIKGTV